MFPRLSVFAVSDRNCVIDPWGDAPDHADRTPPGRGVDRTRHADAHSRRADPAATPTGLTPVPAAFLSIIRLSVFTKERFSDRVSPSA